MVIYIYFLFYPDIKGTVGPGGAVLERNSSLDNVLDTSRTAKYDHMNEYKKIKEVNLQIISFIYLCNN